MIIANKKKVSNALNFHSAPTMGIDTNRGRKRGISHTVFQKTEEEKNLLKKLKSEYYLGLNKR